jgi:hypothetical protein
MSPIVLVVDQQSIKAPGSKLRTTSIVIAARVYAGCLSRRLKFIVVRVAKTLRFCEKSVIARVQ